MRLEIVNTFLTAVADADDADEEGGASCLLRRHSAPPAFQYTDRVSLLAEPNATRSRQRKLAAKKQNATLAAAADAADDAVFMEFAAKVEEERLQGGEPEPPSAALTRRRERRQQAKAKGSAADTNPPVRLCLRFHRTPFFCYARTQTPRLALPMIRIGAQPSSGIACCASTAVRRTTMLS